jgi:hypothetical protein
MAIPRDIATEGPREQPVGITRRQALKKGVIFGGALAWATPVVQVIGMKPALAQVASPIGDRVVTVVTGAVTRCFLVTQEVFDCFQEECAGQPGELGCLNQCLDDHGIGELDEVDCPPAD